MLEYHNWFMLSKEKLCHKVRKCTNEEDEFASSQVPFKEEILQNQRKQWIDDDWRYIY